MVAFAKGDIVLFPFPFTDLTNRKLRPCLVLSREMGEDILLCQITSKQVRPDVHSIELNESDTEQGGLMIGSYIRCNMLFTAEKSQILKKICIVSKRKYDEVARAITKLIS